MTEGGPDHTRHDLVRAWEADRPAMMDAVSQIRPASENNGGSHDRAEGTARRVRAVALRLSGLTYDQVAEQAGYSDRGTARRAVLAALDHVEAESVAEYRALENARYDRAQAALWPLVTGPRLGTGQANAVSDDIKIKAVNSWLGIATRRARLNGLDAPQQVVIGSGTVAELEDLLGEYREVIAGEVIDEQPEPPVQG